MKKIMSLLLTNTFSFIISGFEMLESLLGEQPHFDEVKTLHGNVKLLPIRVRSWQTIELIQNLSRPIIDGWSEANCQMAPTNRFATRQNNWLTYTLKWFTQFPLLRETIYKMF